MSHSPRQTIMLHDWQYLIRIDDDEEESEEDDEEKAFVSQESVHLTSPAPATPSTNRMLSPSRFGTSFPDLLRQSTRDVIRRLPTDQYNTISGKFTFGFIFDYWNKSKELGTSP